MSDKRPDCEKRTGEICEGFRGFMDRMYHDQRALSETLDERDDELTRLRAQRDKAREALLSIAAFAPGNGDVCETIAKHARRALAEIEKDQ